MTPGPDENYFTIAETDPQFYGTWSTGLYCDSYNFLKPGTEEYAQ